MFDELVAGPDPTAGDATFGWFRARLAGYLHLRRTTPALTPRSPAMRHQLRWLEAPDRRTVSARLQVSDAAVPAGDYVFAVDTWATAAPWPEFHLVGFAVELAGPTAAAPAVEERLLELLTTAGAAPHPADAGAVERARHLLDKRAKQHRRAAAAAATETRELLVARRLARLERATRLATEHLTPTDPRRARVDSVYRQHRSYYEDRRTARIRSRRIAEGVLTVTHP